MEKTIKAGNGWLMLGLFFVLVILGIWLLVAEVSILFGVIALTVGALMLPGFMAIEPNSSRVMTLFGSYMGTVKESGFAFTNPFYEKKKVSLRAHNLDIAPIKVNDKLGNPIMIGAVVVWKVEDTFKAVFDVDKFEPFVHTQSEAAIRMLAGSYAYDNLEDEHASVTLRSSASEVNEALEQEIAARLAIAGIYVIEARISHLAYSTEIAGAMLQRQQASAIVAARSKIVEGAVGMVEMALEQLSRKEIIHLDEEKKAAMVSNLMVVLCSERAATPVVNSGTLHQ